MMLIIITVLVAFIIAFILGIALGFFRDFFAVPQDPTVDYLRDALPGANCGACGFPGCENYAAAIAAGEAGADKCTVGGPATAEKIASIAGISAGNAEHTITILACQGSSTHTVLKGSYSGVQTCRAVKLSSGGIKLCSWSCQGFGDCVKVCKFDAIQMGEDGLPFVDTKKCTGCQMCVRECPQGVLKAIPFNQKGAIALCSNKNPVVKNIRKACKISCFKCGLCVKNCPKQCISLDAQVPVVDYSVCDSCGTCVEKCPSKVIKIIERDLFNQARICI